MGATVTDRMALHFRIDTSMEGQVCCYQPVVLAFSDLWLLTSLHKTVRKERWLWYLLFGFELELLVLFTYCILATVRNDVTEHWRCSTLMFSLH